MGPVHPLPQAGVLGWAGGAGPGPCEGPGGGLGAPSPARAGFPEVVLCPGGGLGALSPAWSGVPGMGWGRHRRTLGSPSAHRPHGDLVGGHRQRPISARPSQPDSADWMLEGAKGMIDSCVGQSSAKKLQRRERREAREGPRGVREGLGGRGKFSGVPESSRRSRKFLAFPSAVRGHEVKINPPHSCSLPQQTHTDITEHGALLWVRTPEDEPPPQKKGTPGGDRGCHTSRRHMGLS